MPELTNPHDRFFKELLARPEAAADFLLPPEIAGALDLTAPEPVRDSFVDAEAAGASVRSALSRASAGRR
jgi:hypothetical protein